LRLTILFPTFEYRFEKLQITQPFSEEKARALAEHVSASLKV